MHIPQLAPCKQAHYHNRVRLMDVWPSGLRWKVGKVKKIRSSPLNHFHLLSIHIIAEKKTEKTAKKCAKQQSALETPAPEQH